MKVFLGANRLPRTCRECEQTFLHAKALTICRHCSARIKAAKRAAERAHIRLLFRGPVVVCVCAACKAEQELDDLRHGLAAKRQAGEPETRSRWPGVAPKKKSNEKLTPLTTLALIERDAEPFFLSHLACR